MKFKAGFFDIGGVLIKYNLETGNPRLTEILGSESVLDLNRRELGKGEISEQYYWEKIIDATKVDYSWKDLSIIFRQEMNTFITKYDLQNHELLDYLKALKEKGIILGTISNTVPQRFEEYIKSKVLDIFDVNIASYISKSKKPDEKIYFDALKAVGLEAKDCFFVDDKERNVIAAEKLGFTGILYDFEKDISLIKNVVEC